MHRTPWIERKFNFDLPVGIFPYVMERLYGTKCRLMQLTDGLHEELLVNKPGNKWSIKEQVGHLADLESLHIGRIDDFQAGKAILRAADMTNTETEKAQHNFKTIQQLVNEFSQKRKELVLRLELLEDDTHNLKSLHPRLNVLVRPVDIAFFIAEHDDHHLAAIRELLKLKKEITHPKK